MATAPTPINRSDRAGQRPASDLHDEARRNRKIVAIIWAVVVLVFALFAWLASLGDSSGPVFWNTPYMLP